MTDASPPLDPDAEPIPRPLRGPWVVALLLIVAAAVAALVPRPPVAQERLA